MRGDNVKDDARALQVLAAQGSSASQMTAATVMDVIARLPDCDGQAADAVSAYTQVKWEDAPRLLNIPKSECLDVWICLPRHNWPKSWQTLKILWYVLNEIYMDTLQQVCYGKDNSRKFSCHLNTKKQQTRNVCLFIENKDYSYR